MLESCRSGIRRRDQAALGALTTMTRPTPKISRIRFSLSFRNLRKLGLRKSTNKRLTRRQQAIDRIVILIPFCRNSALTMSPDNPTK